MSEFELRQLSGLLQQLAEETEEQIEASVAGKQARMQMLVQYAAISLLMLLEGAKPGWTTN